MAEKFQIKRVYEPSRTRTNQDWVMIVLGVLLTLLFVTMGYFSIGSSGRNADFRKRGPVKHPKSLGASPGRHLAACGTIRSRTMEHDILYDSNRISSRSDKIFKNTSFTVLLAAWDENCSMAGLTPGNVAQPVLADDVDAIRACRLRGLIAA